MTKYLALLRGVNVGGNGLLPMAALREALGAIGLQNVQTYIQSGNVIFTSNDKSKPKLAAVIRACIQKDFKLDVAIALFTVDEWRSIIASAPVWWGQDETWKHNLLILTEPLDMKDVVAAIGKLKPDIEALDAGKGVLYQSVSFKLFGRTTTGKLASNPIYKQMTIRNYNTANKLLPLLDKPAE